MKELRICTVACTGDGGIDASLRRAAHEINLHPNGQGPFSENLGRAAVAHAAGIPVVVFGF